MSKNTVAGVAGVSSLAFAMLGGLQPALAADGADGADDQDQTTEVVVKGEKNVEPKRPTPLRDTPKSVTVIPQEIIKSTGSTSLVDALRTVPGITFGAGEGGNPVGDRPFLRGYDSQSSTFVDGVRDIGAQSREVFNLEDIEVVKGASGAYAGRGGAGGGVYLNNKTPKRDDFSAVSVGVGTDDYKRATFDVNHVVNDDKTIGVRLNGLVHDAGVAGRGPVKNSRWGIAPSLAFGMGTKTRTTLSYYHLQSDDLPDSGIPYNNANIPDSNATLAGNQHGSGNAQVIAAKGDGQPLNVARDAYYGMVNRDFRRERVDTGTLRVEHDLGRDLHFRNTTRVSNSAQDYVWTQPDDSKGNYYFGLIWRRANSRVTEVSTLVNQTDLYGKFNWGSAVHNVSTGVEFSREAGENDSYTLTQGGIATGTSTCLANAIAAGLCTTVNNPNPYDAFNGTITRVANPSNTRTLTSGLYAFDTIEFNDHWQANLGIRFDNYKTRSISARATGTNVRTILNREDDLVNYQAGVVYKPTKLAAFYVSYATASTPAGNTLNQGSEGNAISATVSLDPEENKTLEAGAKWDALGGKLSLTSSVFEVKTTNSRITLQDGTVAMAGEKRVRGVEIGISGSVTEKWDVFGGYTYLDAILVKAGGSGANFGLTDGQVFPNTPKNSASIWTTYRVLSNLTIGGGATYVDKVYGNASATAPKWVPSYTRVDATASYRINDKLDLQLNVQNLTDEVYFSQAYPTHYATIAPGRSAVLTLNARF